MQNVPLRLLCSRLTCDLDVARRRSRGALFPQSAGSAHQAAISANRRQNAGRCYFKLDHLMKRTRWAGPNWSRELE